METRFFKALCDPNRVAILAELAQHGGKRTVSEIAADLPIDISVVSRHLAILRDADVLVAERRGRSVCYSVSFAGLAGILRTMADAIEACCPDDLEQPEGAEK